MLIDHMSQGYSYQSFAADIDVSFDTLYEWEKVHPEFSESKKVGWAKSLKHWESIGIDSSIDKSNVNTAMWIFTMKCKFRKQGWNEDASDEDKEKKPTLTLEDAIALSKLLPKEK